MLALKEKKQIPKKKKQQKSDINPEQRSNGVSVQFLCMMVFYI